MIPLVFKKRASDDPEVVRGYESTYSYSMRLCGLYPDLRGPRYYLFGFYLNSIHAAYTWFVLAYIVSTYYAFAYNDIELLAYELCYGLLTLIFFLVAHYVMYRRNHLDSLFRAIGKGLFTYEKPTDPEEQVIVDSCNKLCEKTARRNVLLSILLTIWICIIPPLPKALEGEYTSVVKGGVPVNKHLALPVWSPYPIDTPLTYWTMFVIEVLAGNIEAFIVGANCTLFCNLCTIFRVLPIMYKVKEGFEVATSKANLPKLCAEALCRQVSRELKLLCLALKNTRSRAIHTFKMRGYPLPPDGEYEKSELFQKCMEHCLDECIRHHVALKKFQAAFQDFVGFPIFAIFSGTALTISAPMFMLLTMTGAQDTLLVAMKILQYSYIIFAFTFFLSAYCLFGQTITNESSSVHFAFYESPWLEANLDFRRKVIMGMVNSRKPFVLTAKGIASASSETLVDIVKTIFSYLNLLAATQ